jgi:hypothetical protein
MARKRATPAAGSPDISPEKLHAEDIAPETLPLGMATLRQQSDAKDAEEASAEHPMPAGTVEIEELSRMIASAESLEQKRNLLARGLAKQKSLGEVEGRRATLWAMEELRTPRASIVGRHLHDHGITENRKHLNVHGFEVYQEIHKQAPEHFSEACKKHLKANEAPASRKESSRASSYIIKDFKRRIELLLRLGYLAPDGKRFWLSTLGAKVFNCWPWWSTRDGEENPRLDSEPPSKSGPP